MANEAEDEPSGESRVLDLRCGVPVARGRSACGHVVTDVDLSDAQIERARGLVPDATFIRADATQLRLPPPAGVVVALGVSVPAAASVDLLGRVGVTARR